MALVQPPPQLEDLELKLLNPPSANGISTNKAELSVLLEKPENDNRYQLPRPRYAVFHTSTKIAFLLIAIFYHTFCFIVHYRNVPIGGSGVLDLPFFDCEQFFHPY